MDNLPENIEIETAFKDYCKGCSVCELEVEEMELGNFMNTSIRYILHCRHDEACERAYRRKEKIRGLRAKSNMIDDYVIDDSEKEKENG